MSDKLKSKKSLNLCLRQNYNEENGIEIYNNPHYYLSESKPRWDYEHEVFLDMSSPNYILYVVYSEDNTMGLIDLVKISKNREELQLLEVDETKYEFIQDVIIEELKVEGASAL